MFRLLRAALLSSLLLILATACGGSSPGSSPGAASALPPTHTLNYSSAMHAPGLRTPYPGCTGCHGANLTGGQGPSCTNCHRVLW